MENLTIEQLKEKLRESNPVKFSYTKVDGNLCEANGTLNPSLIPADFQPKDSSTMRINPNLRYYDLTKNGWRSITQDCSTINIY